MDTAIDTTANYVVARLASDRVGNWEGKLGKRDLMDLVRVVIELATEAVDTSEMDEAMLQVSVLEDQLGELVTEMLDLSTSLTKLAEDYK